MLYVFKTRDVVEIAWNGEVPATRMLVDSVASRRIRCRGLIGLIRTRSAG